MTNLASRGPISDQELTVLESGGILLRDGQIQKIDGFQALRSHLTGTEHHLIELNGKHTCLPGFVDAHTHICFGGSRAGDYAKRNSGKSYLEIAREGGGIWDTVTKTRASSNEELVKGILKRAKRHIKNGTTTIEVKSGYGLSVDEELKMLRAIREADTQCSSDLIATCLAAHMHPKDYHGTSEEYLDDMLQKLLPQIRTEGLSKRIDIFVDRKSVV